MFRYYIHLLGERIELHLYLAVQRWMSRDLNPSLCEYLWHWGAYSELMMPCIITSRARGDLAMGRLHQPPLHESRSLFQESSMSFLILFPNSKFFSEAKCILIIFSVSFYYSFHKQKWETLTTCSHSSLMIAEQQSWIPWTIFGKQALLLNFLILKWHRFLETSNGVAFCI